MHNHYIIGTAGHIDHGKTTLSKALTGKDTDRLKEEKERSISIELGFAPFKLPNGNQVSLIDVPGHEKFIRHMVAGVGGIDLVLLVIAADEGIMPQTKEHIEIIKLLGIQHGIIVITKSDLVDQEFLDLSYEEIKEFVSETSLKSVPIIPVSSYNHQGIDQLKKMIQEELQKIPERPSAGFFRMPIDRVFTLKGIGTVITGTVYSGEIENGQELSIMPSNIPVRVRSLQVHDESVDKAYAGQRVAINIAGADVSDINRGDSIASKGQWIPSTRIDIELNILKDLDFELKQNSEVKFLIGTSEVTGTILLYDRKEALPGDTVFCQIKLMKTIISSRKERFIIRRPSPTTTIGGGTVIEPNAQRHKYKHTTIEHLKQRSEGTLEEILLSQLISNKDILSSLQELSNDLIIPKDELEKELKKLVEKDKVIHFYPSNPHYAEKLVFKQLESNIFKHLTDYHASYPLRLGQPKAEFIKQFFKNIKPKIIQDVIQYWQQKEFFKTNEEFISLFQFVPTLPQKLQGKIDRLEANLLEQGFAPDDWESLATQFRLTEKEKIESYNFLLSMGRILKLTDKIVIHEKAFTKLKGLVTEFLLKEGQMTLQQAKELIQVSRKYLVPLMELLDQEKVTVLRQGHNYRELRKN